MVCVETTGGGRAVVLVGGMSATAGFLSDAHVLDCASWRWSAVAAEADAFSPRDKLSAVSFGTRVFVFGGFGPGKPVDSADSDDSGADEGSEGDAGGSDSGSEEGASFTWFNDLHVLQQEGGSWKWHAPVTLGDAPTPRAAHAAAAVGGRMLVFGGRCAEGRTNDCFSLDVASMTWAQEKPTGAVPAPRSFAVLAPTHASLGVLCFGGVGADGTQLDSLDVLDMRGALAWAQPETRSGEWPPGRAVAASASLGASRLVVISAASVDTQPCACYLIDAADICRELAAPPAAAKP
jgi:hypothetical protein